MVEVDVLNLREGIPGTTIVGDLADASQIPSDCFDCVIVPQTLQFIYDVHSAVRTLHRILKPGGGCWRRFPESHRLTTRLGNSPGTGVSQGVQRGGFSAKSFQ